MVPAPGGGAAPGEASGMRGTGHNRGMAVWVPDGAMRRIDGQRPSHTFALSFLPRGGGWGMAKHRDIPLEALRGLAAVVVLAWHALLAFDPGFPKEGAWWFGA